MGIRLIGLAAINRANKIPDCHQRLIGASGALQQTVLDLDSKNGEELMTRLSYGIISNPCASKSGSKAKTVTTPSLLI